jgi:hypothetical protein
VEKQARYELTPQGKVKMPNTTRRGMPKGGWPKKDPAQVKLDHPPEHLLFPTPDHLKMPQPKFDLSSFQKVSFERRVMGKPIVRIGRNECSFNVTAHLDYGLDKFQSYDVYIDRGKTMTQIAFVPRTDDDGTFKSQRQKKQQYSYITSVKLIRYLNVKPGKCRLQMVDGVLVAEAENNAG